MRTKGMMRFKITIEADVLFDLTPEMSMNVIEVQGNADAGGEINFETPLAISDEDALRLKTAGLDAALRYVSHRATENVKKVGSMVERAHIASIAFPHDPEDLN